MPAMAYSPVEQGRLLTNPTLAQVAETIGATPARSHSPGRCASTA
jgi:diketogulonate reductase-like aldo/keto reductase